MRAIKIILLNTFLLVFIGVFGAWGALITGGTPLLCDYFDPECQGLVKNVESHHLLRNPYLFAARPKLGIARLISSEDYKTAVREIVYVLDRICNHPKALEVMGDLAILMKDPMLGEFYYKRAVILYPQYAITHYQFGSFLIDIEELDEGINELNRAVEIEPSLAMAHARLSEAYARKGDAGKALMEEKTARELGYREDVSDNVVVTTIPDEKKGIDKITPGE